MNKPKYVHNPTRPCSCTIKIEGENPVRLSIVYCATHNRAYDPIPQQEPQTENRQVTNG